jgi:aryl-phospho-beta-D-glucosidase BglC (GH1 family)
MNQIKVTGNKFTDESGKQILFRGVSISDPEKLEQSGHWNKAYLQEAKNWGANIIRIPVLPYVWRNRGTENYLKLLDQGVKWAKEIGLYIIIDWHAMGNHPMELYQKREFSTSKKETFEFWHVIADHYKNNATVAFYEIFNEPTDSRGHLGNMTWHQWKISAEEIIALIRSYNPKTIILVGGIKWAYDLGAVKDDPIKFENIAYVTHPYPKTSKQPWESHWESDFGYLTEKYPIIATEMGFASECDKSANATIIGDEVYGRHIVDYFDKKRISWLVWVFDPNWGPKMFLDWNYTPSPQGEFFKQVLQSSKK